jgi:hypothetical protein
MTIPANLLAQTGIAAYFVAIYLQVTLPLGAVLFVAAAVVHAWGARSRGRVGVPAGTLRRVGIAAALGTVGTLLLAGYHGSYWNEHHWQTPGEPFPMAVVALLAIQIALIARVAYTAQRRAVAVLWGAVWLWVQLVGAVVALGGPALGGL